MLTVLGMLFRAVKLLVDGNSLHVRFFHWRSPSAHQCVLHTFAAIVANWFIHYWQYRVLRNLHSLNSFVLWSEASVWRKFTSQFRDMRSRELVPLHWNHSRSSKSQGIHELKVYIQVLVSIHQVPIHRSKFRAHTTKFTCKVLEKTLKFEYQNFSRAKS